jgi:hypothetical protein
MVLVVSLYVGSNRIYIANNATLGLLKPGELY